jgi:hypothetical protein
MNFFAGYSDLTKALLALSIACCALIVMILAWCTFWIYTCPQAEKLVMPGSYKVTLSKDAHIHRQQPTIRRCACARSISLYVVLFEPAI